MYTAQGPNHDAGLALSHLSDGLDLIIVSDDKRMASYSAVPSEEPVVLSKVGFPRSTKPGVIDRYQQFWPSSEFGPVAMAAKKTRLKELTSSVT